MTLAFSFCDSTIVTQGGGNPNSELQELLADDDSEGDEQ